MDFCINQQTIDEGFTQSEISLMSQCAYKWYLHYNLRLERIGNFSWALVVGTAWHKIMEQMYATKGKRWSVPEDLDIPTDHARTAEDDQMVEHWLAILQTMAEEYVLLYKDDFKVFKLAKDGIEYSADIEVEIDGIKIRLRGKLDLIGQLGGTRMAIGDHKTASRIDDRLLEGWDFKFQFMFYLWLNKQSSDKPAKEFLVNGAKKPELRRGKNETIPMFTARCQTDIKTRPEEYFQRKKLNLRLDSMKNFEDDILIHKLHKLKMLVDPKTPEGVKRMIALDKNTDSCHSWGRSCEYLCICQHGLDNEMHQFFVKDHKHSELGEEE